ncbi:hypothetical protein JW949_04415 [Candidatus Woesearchaeota archaeon]|nr:hypothetical protein [Candidatus Woesearchaeota archaeon]
MVKIINEKTADKIKEIINYSDFEELKFLKDMVEKGSFMKIVESRIEEYESHRKICPVCHSELNAEESFVLYFGPKGLRKKAHFCALDCLDYFVTQLNEQRKKRLRNKTGN